MIRAFVAIGMPPEILPRLDALADSLPMPRRVPEENMHLTLAFLGETPNPVLEEAHLAFEALRAPAFDLELSGVNSFGGTKPRLVYAGVAPNPALMALQKKVTNAARLAGCTVESRRFTPHVTLGRFSPEAADLGRLQAAMVRAATFSAGPARINEFTLYQSHLTADGPIYEPLASYPLR